MIAGNEQEVLISIPELRVADQTSLEGLSKAFDLGSFTDEEGGPWSVSVDWGDGSALADFTTNSAGALGAKSHTYADNGVYPVTVKVTDKDGWTGTQSFKVTVANVPPPVGPISGPTAPVPLGTTVPMSSPFTDPGIPNTHTAVIDWGDGSTSPGAVTETNGSGTVAGTHAYTNAGLY